MRGITGQEQPAPAEPVGHPVLHPDPRGPRQVGDPRGQARLVHQRLQLGGGNRGTGLPERLLVRAGGPGRQQPPGRPLAEAEHEQQSPPPGHHLGGVIGEITLEFGVGQQDLHRVRAPGPPDAGLGPHDTGRAVAARDETELGLLGPGR